MVCFVELSVILSHCLTGKCDCRKEYSDSLWISWIWTKRLSFLTLCIKHNKVPPFPAFAYFSSIRFAQFQILSDVALGLMWLHQMNIVHANLKPSNIRVFPAAILPSLWSLGLNVQVTPPIGPLRARGKLCDMALGYSSDQTENWHTDFVFKAPEGFILLLMCLIKILEFGEAREEMNFSADIYSFGLIFWEVLAGRPVFSHYTSMTTFYSEVVEKGVRPSMGIYIYSTCFFSNL